MKNRSKKIVISLLVLAALVAALLAAYHFLKPETASGAKAVEITVVNSSEVQKNYTTNTDGEYLIDAMEDTDGLNFQCDDGEYGLTLISVNGETADSVADNVYWALYLDGEYCNYGVSQQPVKDGDHFEIRYETFE